jgi:hypothetical protein
MKSYWDWLPKPIKNHILDLAGVERAKTPKIVPPYMFTNENNHDFTFPWVSNVPHVKEKISTMEPSYHPHFWDDVPQSARE